MHHPFSAWDNNGNASINGNGSGNGKGSGNVSTSNCNGSVNSYSPSPRTSTSTGSSTRTSFMDRKNEEGDSKVGIDMDGKEDGKKADAAFYTGGNRGPFYAESGIGAVTRDDSTGTGTEAAGRSFYQILPRMSCFGDVQHQLQHQLQHQPWQVPSSGPLAVPQERRKHYSNTRTTTTTDEEEEGEVEGEEETIFLSPL
jgi:hypothetical protein